MKILKLQQKIHKAERIKQMKQGSMQTSSTSQRRARTRSLIQLGGLLELAGTLDVFGIPLGVDLQKDVSVKNNIAALFKGLLELNEMVESSETVDLNLWALQGLDAFKAKGVSETRPLDRQKGFEFSQDSANNNELQKVVQDS
jgi:hypothetical protein